VSTEALVRWIERGAANERRRGLFEALLCFVLAVAALSVGLPWRLGIAAVFVALGASAWLGAASVRGRSRKELLRLVRERPTGVVWIASRKTKRGVTRLSLLSDKKALWTIRLKRADAARLLALWRDAYPATYMGQVTGQRHRAWLANPKAPRQWARP